MLLAIDVGNTNTVFAVFKSNTLEHSWRCETVKSRSVDEYAVFLKQLFDLVDLSWSDISDVIISSVVPDADFHLLKFCKKYIDKDAIFVDSTIAGVTVNLDQPDEIGADRLVNTVAVIHYYTTPAIVIDFGTATTFDVIEKDGSYSGGVIAPGIRLSAKALTQHAAKLPQVNIEKPEKIIGKNTQSAMQSGMYWGYIGVIETIVERIKEEMKSEVFVLATGGLAPLYAESTNAINAVDETLILKGLQSIYQKVKAKN